MNGRGGNRDDSECDVGKSGSVHYKQQATPAFFFFSFLIVVLSSCTVSVFSVCLCIRPVSAAALAARSCPGQAAAR